MLQPNFDIPRKGRTGHLVTPGDEAWPAWASYANLAPFGVGLGLNRPSAGAAASAPVPAVGSLGTPTVGRWRPASTRPLSGANFVNPSVTRIDGVVVPNTWDSASQLTVTIPEAVGYVLGGHTVTVDGATSSASFTVAYDAGSFAIYDFGVGITNPGGIIQAMSTANGNAAANLGQATSGKRPTHTAVNAAYNGKPTAAGDGIDDLLETASFSPITGPYALAYVGQTTGATGTNRFPFGCGQGAAGFTPALRASTTDTLFVQGTSAIASAGPAVMNQKSIVVGEYVSSTVTRGYLNSTTVNVTGNTGAIPSLGQIALFGRPNSGGSAACILAFAAAFTDLALTAPFMRWASIEFDKALS